MAWSLSQAMVEEMEDRLLELFTQAEKKAAKVNEKARLAATGEIKKPLSDTETSHTDSQAAAQEKRKPLGVTREKKAIRTGGMGAMVGSSSSNSAESRPSTSAGTGTGSKTKLTEATPGVTVTRPTTAPDKQPPAQGQQGADKGRLFGGKRPSAPAWALRKSDSSDRGSSSSNSSSAADNTDAKLPTPAPKGRWAARDSNQLQILGKPISRGKGVDRHKLTLEMTVDEATWKAPLPSSPSMLAKTLEDSDDVLLEDSASESSGSSDDEEVMEAVVDKDGDSDEDDKLNRTNSQLDELEEHAMQLETWLERKASLLHVFTLISS